MNESTTECYVLLIRRKIYHLITNFEASFTVRERDEKKKIVKILLSTNGESSPRTGQRDYFKIVYRLTAKIIAEILKERNQQTKTRVVKITCSSCGDGSVCVQTGQEEGN